MLKKLVPLIAAAVIAVSSYFVLGTPVGEAVAIAFNQEKAVAACQKLLTAEIAQ